MSPRHRTCVFVAGSCVTKGARLLYSVLFWSLNPADVELHALASLSRRIFLSPESSGVVSLLLLFVFIGGFETGPGILAMINALPKRVVWSRVVSTGVSGELGPKWGRVRDPPALEIWKTAAFHWTATLQDGSRPRCGHEIPSRLSPLLRIAQFPKGW